MTYMYRHNIKSKVRKLYAAILEPKLARTYTDDVDVYHGLVCVSSRRGRWHRPGSRDDESYCTFGKILPV